MTEISPTESQPTSFELLLVSENNEITHRVKQTMAAFSYGFQVCVNPDEISEKYENIKIKFLVLDASMANTQNEVVGQIQGIRYFYPEVPILVVFSKRFDKSTLPWIRKSGANFVMSESDFLSFPRFDFFANQYIGSDFLPVKHADFEPGTSIEIPLYYFMPINRKYFPLIAAGTSLDQGRIEKIQKIGEVYIRRVDVDSYNQYLIANQDQSAKGLARRCRMQFNEFRGAFLNLVNHLTEEAENPSYDEGKKLLETIQKMAQDLINMMMSVSSVFDIINQSVEGEYNSVDRAPERAVIVGYFTIMGSIGKTDVAMLASLLSDIGMLNMPVETLNHFRLHGYTDLNEAMKKSYEQHPQYSINFAAQKKIVLEPPVRDTILYSHSRQDEQGFPVVRPGRISIEAQLIHFTQLLDDRCQVKWGKPRPSYTEELRKMLFDKSAETILSPDVLKALRNIV